jgi:MraZ protein
VDENETVTTIPPVEFPRGRFPGKLDDKGRLKLPADFQKFFNGLAETKLFLTSLDRSIAQLYPIAEWRKNELFFENFKDAPVAARIISFNANDLGADVEMDGQGRITVHPDLRRELGMEATDLHLIAAKGHIDIYTNARYQAMKNQAGADESSVHLDTLKMAGFR